MSHALSVSRDGIQLAAMIGGRVVYTARSRRADHEWLADQFAREAVEDRFGRVAWDWPLGASAPASAPAPAQAPADLYRWPGYFLGVVEDAACAPGCR